MDLLETPGPAVTAVIRRMLRRGRRCLLCRGAPEVAGLFDPGDQAGCRAPPGKTRSYVYLLCGHCHLLPDSEARVEARVLREIGGTPNPELN